MARHKRIHVLILATTCATMIAAAAAGAAAAAAAAAAFALPYPGWLLPLHPMARVAQQQQQQHRARGSPYLPTIAAASAAPSSPSSSSSSSPYVCRPRGVGETDESREKDWPELRSLLGGLVAPAPLEEKKEEEMEEQQHYAEEASTGQPKISDAHEEVNSGSAAKVDWLARLLSSSLREEYKRHLR